MLEFIKGRSNLSCTIFVPFDCQNHCRFCNSKILYSKYSMDMERILEDIDFLNESSFFETYVLTGGEPISDFESMKLLISRMTKPVYINTTLPMQSNLDEIIDYINHERKIYGVNISRHIGQDLRDVAPLSYIERIKKDVRINTVINDRFNFNNFLNFVHQYGGYRRLINLRADYTKINELTLKNRDEICNKLLEVGVNVSNGGCMVCNENEFYIDGILVYYHRGLQYSSFMLNNKVFINDIIIRPDGIICKDWDFEEDFDFNVFLRRR